MPFLPPAPLSVRLLHPGVSASPPAQPALGLLQQPMPGSTPPALALAMEPSIITSMPIPPAYPAWARLPSPARLSLSLNWASPAFIPSPLPLLLIIPPHLGEAQPHFP